METEFRPATPEECCALDTALTDADWPLVRRLWGAGLTNAALYRLLRLRVAYRRRDPATDGLEADPRARFVRWLVATGRLSDFGGSAA